MLSARVPVLLSLLLAGCSPTTLSVDDKEGVSDDTDVPDEPVDDPAVDDDGDGFSEEQGDCDDDDADVHPDGDEGDRPDGVDQDCDGTADDRVVCDDSLADYATIQEALEDAPDGFVVLVCPGTYTENLRANDRELTLRSIGGPEVTILDGGGRDATLTVVDGEFALEGFAVTGGLGAIGGGVACEGARLSLSGNGIGGNAAEYGGGLGAVNCQVTITGNAIAGNTATAAGGGAFFNRSRGDFAGNHVEANVGLEGGGVAVFQGGLTITDNDIVANEATTTDEEYRYAGSGGGGLWFDGNTTVRDNRVRQNTSQYNGGGLFSNEGSGDISGNEITGNHSVEDGAGIYTALARNRFTGNTVVDNVADDDGGGLRIYVGRMTIEGNHFEGNSAADDGGGAKMSHSTNTFRDNVLIGNSAGDAGGGLELDNETANVSGCTFEGNSARRGGGLHSWRNEGAFTISDNSFTGNHASGCGGGLAFDNDRFLVTLRHLTITGNTADDGAAFCTEIALQDDETYVASNILFTNSLMVGNEASDDGGVAYVKAASVTLRNVVMHDNEGPGAAGFAVKTEGALLVTNSTVSDNRGSDLVLLEEDGAFSATWSAFSDNEGYEADEAGGNIGEDPRYANTNQGDFSLLPNSPCIDAGDPAVRDADNSRSDMGAFGGPNGSW